jgi:hypothetical protein
VPEPEKPTVPGGPATPDNSFVTPVPRLGQMVEYTDAEGQRRIGIVVRIRGGAHVHLFVLPSNAGNEAWVEEGPAATGLRYHPNPSFMGTWRNLPKS